MTDIPDAAVDAARLEWVGDHLWYGKEGMGYVANLGGYWIARATGGRTERHAVEEFARKALERMARETLGI